MQNSISLLADIIENAAPKKIVAAGHNAINLAKSWSKAHSECTYINLDLSDPERVLRKNSNIDLALISETLENCSQPDGEKLLALLRNYGTHQIAVGISEHGDWNFNQFIALGFRRHISLEDHQPRFTLYTYNLDSYNHKRTWNNSRFWANPEMWGKAHW